MSDLPRVLGLSEVRHQLGRFLEKPAQIRRASGVWVRVAPEWVTAVGLCKAGGSYWLWLERYDATSDHDGGGPAAGLDQLVLDVPPGRYLVDMLDVTNGETLSRETAGGPPLVLGVPSRGVPIVAEIRPVGTAGSRQLRRSPS
jgi:hypothetical protein